MTIKILMLLGKVSEHRFLYHWWRALVRPWSVATIITLLSNWNQIFSALGSPILEVKKRKSIRISLRIHLSALQKTGLTVNASITGKCVVDSKARTILEVFSFFTNHNFGSGQFLWEGIFNQLADRGALLGTMFSLRTIALKRVSCRCGCRFENASGFRIIVGTQSAAKSWASGFFKSDATHVVNLRFFFYKVLTSLSKMVTY